MTEKEKWAVWKKAFLIGIGATAATIEKIQEFANELVERGELSQKDAKGFADDLMSKALKEKEQFEARIKELVESSLKSLVKSMGLVTQADLEALRKELNAAKPNGKAKGK